MTDRDHLSACNLAHCLCCRELAAYSVLLANSGEGDDYYYLPNQFTRAVQGTFQDDVRQVPFCRRCMRFLEDQLRATISSLKDQSIKFPNRTPNKIVDNSPRAVRARLESLGREKSGRE